MTASRGLALGALGVALVVVAVVLLGGGATHTYKLRFENAGQLVKDDDVQIGGRRVGSIRTIELTDDNEAEITVELQEPYAPLHRGTTASIRATSLSGIANRYIALTPAPNSAPKLDDGSVLTADATTPIVDLDQLFNTLDEKTRASLQQVIKGSATQYEGRGAEANAGAKYFSPAISTSARLVNEVDRDQQAFEDVIVYGAKVTTALAERRSDLSNLVANAATTAGAIGDENQALATTLDLLPGTLRKANTTFVNLRATLTDLDNLTDASLPATKKLAPLLRALRPLVADARPTIRDLRLLVTQPGGNNDLIDLLKKAPRLESLAKPTFANSIAALRKSEPVVGFVRPYSEDFVGWLRDFSQTTANYDANGHYARIQPIFNAFSFTSNPTGGTLRAIPNSDKFAGLQTGNLTRCPGAASQAPPDGSAPWRDTDGKLDCDPTQIPPGP
jgi:phospholipid/cholesterol/gamma-HCH transport system substrate-binding protein